MTQLSFSPARADVDAEKGIIVASVEIAAPPARVFRALTDAAEILQWWGSAETYHTEQWTSDLRVGGRWRAQGRNRDGSAYIVEGEYLLLEPPRVLAQTWQADWDGGHVTTLRYDLEAIPGGTRLRVRHEGFQGRAESCRGHGQGWELVLGWVCAYATRYPEPNGGGA